MNQVKCTSCGASPAYIGLFGNKCECSNPSCKCYSPELYPADPAAEILETKKESQTLSEEDIEKKPVWIWSTRHNDFGDI